MAKKVEIYTTPSCKFCTRAKEYMKENDIKYKDYNIREDEDKRQEMIEKSGAMSVPVIVMGDEVMVGFEEDKFEEMRKEYQDE